VCWTNAAKERSAVAEHDLQKLVLSLRAVVQRVAEASVAVNDGEVARIGRGLVALVGCAEGDDDQDVRFIADKIANLRIFEDEEGRMNLSVTDVGGEALLVPNFTLLGDARKGRRPSFTRAAAPELAEQLIADLTAYVAGMGVKLKTGVFKAHMAVSLVNDGPVTVLLDSRRDF